MDKEIYVTLHLAADRVALEASRDISEADAEEDRYREVYVTALSLLVDQYNYYINK